MRKINLIICLVALMSTASFTDPNGDYTRELLALDSSIVIEKIRLKNNEFGMERRFAKSNDEWYLIYYAAMNRLVKNNSIDSNME